MTCVSEHTGRAHRMRYGPVRGFTHVAGSVKEPRLTPAKPSPRPVAPASKRRLISTSGRNAGRCGNTVARDGNTAEQGRRIEAARDSNHATVHSNFAVAPSRWQHPMLLRSPRQSPRRVRLARDYHRSRHRSRLLQYLRSPRLAERSALTPGRERTSRPAPVLIVRSSKRGSLPTPPAKM